jgi:hypothetical protein
MKPHLITAAKPLWLAPVLLILSAAAGPGSLAGVTSLLLDSEPGEFIGGGEFNFYTPADGTFAVLPSSPSPPPLPGADVRLTFRATGFRLFWSLEFWNLEFAAPEGELLAVGAYEYDARFPRLPGQPRLQVNSDAGICLNTFGRFEVKQVDFDADGTLAAFWATFEQTCADAVLRGEVRYSADVPVVLSAPSRRTAFEGQNLLFEVEGFDTQGHPVALSATGLPPGADLTDAGDGTGHFDWTPGLGQAGLYWVGLHGQGMGGDTDVVYTRVEAIPDFDDFDHPVPFSTLPFVSTVDEPEASRAADDPICLDPSWETEWGTVWYAFTPVEDVRINAGAARMLPFPPVEDVRINSTRIPPIPLYTAVSVYTGERGALEQLACDSVYARFDADAGQTYFIMVGFSEPDSPLRFQAEALPPPPANDDFDAATVVGALPFSESLDTRGAIAEREDPGLCGDGPQLPNVWYAYTPEEDTRVTVDTAGSTYFAQITAFSGPRGLLVPVGCDDSRLSFTAHAGRTYHVMIAGSLSSFGSLLQVSFTGAPALDIEVSIDAEGAFDPHRGIAVIRGTARCSRSARIVVSGILQQGGEKAQGDYEALVACTGVTGWRAEVAADRGRSRHGRFTGGPATATFEAVGVPDDNPDDAAEDSGRTTVNLKGAAPHRAQPGH